MTAEEGAAAAWIENFEDSSPWDDAFLDGRESPLGKVSFGPDGGRFRLDPPHSNAAWTLTTTPVWVKEFPLLELDYQFPNPPSDGAKITLLLSDDSTGPVTPGALNPENPFASGGSIRIELNPEKKAEVLHDLTGAYASDRVARISIQLETGSSPVSLLFKSIRFRTRESKDGSGVSVCSTGVAEKESINLHGCWRGSGLGLSLGFRRFGSDRPWYSENSQYIRERPVSPHQASIRIRYCDGSVRVWSPFSDGEAASIARDRLRKYIIPLDPEKILTRIEIADRMSDGQALLYADPRLFACPPLLSPLTLFPKEVWKPSPPSPWEKGKRREGDRRTRLPQPRPFSQREKGANSALANLLKHSKTGEAAKIFLPDGSPLPLVHESSDEYRKKDGLVHTCRWRFEKGQSTGGLELKIEAFGGNELRLTPSVAHYSGPEISLDVQYPILDDFRVANAPEDRWYLLGTRNAYLSNRDIQFEERYGGAYPLQFIDLFSRGGDGGLGLIMEDGTLLPKIFHFNQDENGADWRIEFPGVRVSPGETFSLPTAVCFSHESDWRPAFERYRTWIRDQQDPPAGRLKDLFYCRRDYPLGGTGYLFDRERKRYTPNRLISESRRNFAGIDLIDISGWAYNEQTGRVGDYLKNDLGGLEELGRAADQAREAGVGCGLYFEGYLLDRRSSLAEKALPDWQLVDKQGGPRWWKGEMEFFVCPGVDRWRGTMADTVAKVAKQTGAVAVYLDQLGFAGQDKMCWSPHHDHPVPSNPLLEEEKMLKTVRRRLDEGTPSVAIYTEQLPCDRLVKWVDAAFDYGMRAYPPDPYAHETKLPLHRFVFPEAAVIEMIGHGIRPIPVEEDDLHLCFFHGLAVWLKGRGESWFSHGFRETARRFYPVLSAHADAFRSPDCEPLIPTLVHGVYANRFSTAQKTVITLYNGNPYDVAGDLAEATVPEGWVVKNLFDESAGNAGAKRGQTILSGRLLPKSSGAFLISQASEVQHD